MILLGLGFFVIGAGAAIALGLLDQALGARHRNRCPVCQCELGACRGHHTPRDGEIFCPLCRAQGAMVTRPRAGPPPPPSASKDPGVRQ